MKKIFLCLLATAFALPIFAQDEFDALRYSNTQVQGTARGIGIGNAMGSLGADFTSLSVNPAGIGLYRKGEMTFTPSFTVMGNKGDYQNEKTSNSLSKLNVAQIGIVFTSAKKGKAYNKAGWKAASFAFGLNKLATFNNEYSYTGKNYISSIVEKFANDFNRMGGLNSSTLSTVNYPAYAAWSTYLIDQDFAGDSTQAFSYVPVSQGLQQTKVVNEKGGMNEFVVSGGGNYMEKLMIGATLGIIRSTYDRTIQFNEEDLTNNTSNDFKYLKYTDRLTTDGTGVNLKLGAIFKPVNAFRIGIAVHTPTKMYFNDLSNMSMESHTDSLKIRNNPTANPITTYTQDSTNAFNYSMNTPYKAIVSATILFNKYGFLTADMEYIDYASMKYDYGIGYENESYAINNVIKNTYRSAVNIRVGAEAKLGDFALRGGVGMYGSPYANNTSAVRTNISGGIGYRAPSWFLDATLMQSNYNYKEQPYVLNTSSVPSATISHSATQVVFTIGRRF